MIGGNRRAELDRVVVAPDLVQGGGEAVQLVLELGEVQFQQMGNVPQLLRGIRLDHEWAGGRFFVFWEETVLFHAG